MSRIRGAKQPGLAANPGGGGLTRPQKGKGIFNGAVFRGRLSMCRFNAGQAGDHGPSHAIDIIFTDHDPETNEFTVQFTEHKRGTQFPMTAKVYPETNRVSFKVAAGPEARGPGVEIACDAEAVLAADGVTMTGYAVCDDACDDGGGEFVLRNDALQFVVTQVGRKDVTGRYSSLGHVQSASGFGGVAAKGAPIYAQTECKEGGKPESGDECPYIIFQRVVGAYKQWWVASVDELNLGGVGGVGGGDELGPALPPSVPKPVYIAWSDSITPPLTGWRAPDAADEPAPMLRHVAMDYYTYQSLNIQLNSFAAPSLGDAPISLFLSTTIFSIALGGSALVLTLLIAYRLLRRRRK